MGTLGKRICATPFYQWFGNPKRGPSESLDGDFSVTDLEKEGRKTMLIVNLRVLTIYFRRLINFQF